jgi:hypothetical protein
MALELKREMQVRRRFQSQQVASTTQRERCGVLRLRESLHGDEETYDHEVVECKSS